MPYWGNTKTEVDDHGPISVKVCYPTESNPVTIALSLDGMYIVLHNDRLYFAKGKISLCLTVEGLPESQGTGFCKDENKVLAALVDYLTECEINDMMEEQT